MKHINTIEEYCKEINISHPRYPFFDIRKFEDNMLSVNLKQSPFRHPFYAIALRLSGQNREVNGKRLESSLFFNTPYQVITWDILPDWKGWYIIFDREFISMNRGWDNFIIEYPFFRLDNYITFDLPADALKEADNYFQKIYDEYHSDNNDKFLFIQAYTQILLSITKRNFEKLKVEANSLDNTRTADILLVSRFQTLIETVFTKEGSDGEIRQPSFYAEQLSVHPNHLNAVMKRITDKTVSQIIQHYIVTFSKSLLVQTSLTIKEVSYRVQFKEPTHFVAFFKKQTGITPQQYRENTIL
ncbi:MAG: helix-turn-helix transcriptional regulator [Bacteroidetes bacterium]|nr:helix-turn-helix transcriptional regulator [Bacteroidota bacterium]